MNLSNYIKDVIKELKLSTFPTQSVVINFTMFVIIFTSVMALFLGALDLLFGGATIKLIEILRGAEPVFINPVTEVATTTQNILQSATNTLVK